MGRTLRKLLFFAALLGNGDAFLDAKRLTLLTADVRTYAPFIVKALYHERIAGTELSALSETEKPINGDSWYWTDDNAKSLEALALPPVYSQVTAQVGQIVRFIIANSPPPFVFRRRVDERLEVKSDNPDDFRVATGLMNFHGNLRRADIRQSYRFHDDRTEDAVKYGACAVRFSSQGKAYTVDTKQNVSRISREAHAVTLIQTIDLKADSAILGNAIFSYRIEANKPYMTLTAEVRSSADTNLTEIQVTTALDELDSLSNVRYSKFFTFPDAKFSGTAATNDRSKSHVLKEGPVRWWSLIQTGDLGFSYSISTIVESQEQLRSIVSTDEQEHGFRHIESIYQLGSLQRGRSVKISERKVLLAGGLYTSMSDYASVFERLDDFPGLDLSISYDIGAELNGVASAYLADKQRLVSSPGQQPVVYKPETRQWFDAILDAYLAKFPIKVDQEYPYLFVRGHSFVILALQTMYRATGDSHYIDHVRHLADILTQMQVKRGALAGTFYCIHHSHFLDCQAAAITAMARAAMATGEPRYAESARMGLNGYHIAPNADTGNDVYLRQRAGAKDGDSYFWVFKAGLLLRSLEALETLVDGGLLRLSQEDWRFLLELQKRAVVYIARTEHSHGLLQELLTCHRAGETNSETQAWALLGLYRIEHGCNKGGWAP